MEKEKIKQICEKYEFWNELEEQNKKEFISETIIEKYSKNQIIYNPIQKCKGIIKVIKGNIRIYMISEEGKEITLYRLYEGDVCTLSASCIMEEIMFDTFMKAEDETEIMVTNIIVLKKLMSQNIFFENYIYKKTVTKFSEVMWNLQDMLFTKLEKRLAIYLLKEEKNGEITVTHEKIAEHLGSAREVISRTLKKFEKEELIKLSRGKITIINSKKLKNIL